MWKILAALLYCLGLCQGQFTNQWAIDVHDPSEENLNRIAQETGCVNDGHVIENTYLLTCHHVRKRSTEPHSETHVVLSTHPSVHFADQQRVLSRKKRQLWRIPQRTAGKEQTFVDLANLNDQRWPQMWYLNRGKRLDMNVQQAWLNGATGKGVSVTILDDGIERSHPDLAANYDPLASFDVNQNDNDPTPRYDIIDSNRHGTRCAGEVAATANNSNCAVGIAFKAGIGGVRMLDGDVTDAVEARSLGLNNQHIDIYSASWGPDDDGKTVDGPGRLATRAFLKGITEGRKRKGSIFVWASGNGGRDYDNCNCDGYTNSIWTLSVSSATENGLIPWYSEACSSTLATTYSSGSSGERKVITTDLHHTCTSSHTGTSASAPLAAGIMALVLESNPELTWRDVQHITVRCAHNANLRANDWATNAVGRNYSHSFGYGLMDASCMVKLAKSWRTMPESTKCTRSAKLSGGLIVQGKTSAKSILDIPDDCDGVKFMEHVQAHVTLSASKRGDVEITLTSPQGTKSVLIAKRTKDYSQAGFNDWPFLTVHMWEEQPVGQWTLEVINDGRYIVELKEWSLAIFGTKEHPNTAKEEPAGKNLNQVAKPSVVVPEVPEQVVGDVSQAEGGLVGSVKHDKCVVRKPDDEDWCVQCEREKLLLNGRCVDACPAESFYEGTENHQRACLHCYYGCRTCSGPNDYQCTSCFADAELDEDASNGEKYCHNKSLVDQVFSSSRWYFALTIGSFVNFAAVLVIAVYFIRRRSRSAAVSDTSPSDKLKKNAYVSVKSATKNMAASPLSSVPFHDYNDDDESSGDEGDLFRKPYADNIA